MPRKQIDEAARELHEKIDDDRKLAWATSDEQRETEHRLSQIEHCLGMAPASVVAAPPPPPADVVRFDELLSPDELHLLEQRYACNFRRDYALDRWDIVASCIAGVVGGAVDFLLVGIPPQVGFLGELPSKGGPLSALLKKWNVDSDNLLARVAKVPYDGLETKSLGIPRPTPRLHRVLTPGHDPSPVGLIVGMFDILRGGKTGISRNGEPFFESGDGVVTKNPVVAITLWMLHLVSDAATKMGLPPPGWTLMPLVRIGSFGDKEMTIGELAQFMYVRGFDLRHFIASGISVVAGHAAIGAYFGARRFLDSGYDADCSRDEQPGASLLQHPRYVCMRMITDVVACAANATKCQILGALGFNYPQWLSLARSSFSVASDWLRSPTDNLSDRVIANETALELELDKIVDRVLPLTLGGGTPPKTIEFNGRLLRGFPGLSAEDIRHPNDQKAFAVLSRIPLLDTVVSKFLEHGLEPTLHLLNLASNIRVTASMFPRLHHVLEVACEVLDVPVPELYVTTDPFPGAFTYGHTKPLIVVTSGLVDMYDDEELLFAIGHEIGHIKANHVLYTTLAASVNSTVRISGNKAFEGIGSLISGGLEFPLLFWSRQSELTADRAGFLCVQNLRQCFVALMKLAGGPKSMFLDMDPAEFEKQVHEYEAPDEASTKKLYKLLITFPETHPFPVLRAKRLAEWSEEVSLASMAAAS